MKILKTKSGQPLIRSPRYPVIGLPEAIERATLVYRKDKRNKIPKSLVAEHMGYQGLNGASLGIISAVCKYGLLDGGVDAMWVTPLAVDIIERDALDPERIDAIRKAATNIDLFGEIDGQFPDKASDSAIRSFLITRLEFLPESAEKLIRSYRETNALVAALQHESSAAAPSDSAANKGPSLGTTNTNVLQPNSDKELRTESPSAGEREWLRGRLSRTTDYRLIVSGEIGPTEISRLIKLLEVQKAVLDEDDMESILG